MLVSLGVLLLGFLFLLPERCAVNMAFLRQDTSAPAEMRQRVELASGFSIALYASDLPGVRVLRFTEAGDLLASLLERATSRSCNVTKTGMEGQTDVAGWSAGSNARTASIVSERPVPSAP